MNMKRVALVTGANKGIGFEIARGLAQAGLTVLMGARTNEKASDAASRLAAEGLEVHPIVLDVTDAATIAAAVGKVAEEHGRLDVLVNNAGVFLDADQKPSTVPLDIVRQTYDTNVFGVIAVTQAFIPLLRKSPAGRIVIVSSLLGSLTHNSNPSHYNYGFTPLAYNSSKTAVNAVAVCFARELAKDGIKVNACCPGYTSTDMTQHKGTKTPAEGARTPIRLALIGDDGPTGGFFDDDGEQPW